MDTPYISSEEFPILRTNTEQNDFSIFHLNIRSVKNFYGNFNFFLSSLNCNFSVIYFWETWLDEKTLSTSRSLYELPNYKSIHQVRNYSKPGGVSIYINKKNDNRFNNRDYSLFFLMGIFLKHLWLIPNILKWQNCKIFTKLVPSQNPSRISHRRCSVKKIFLKIYKISRENICVGVCQWNLRIF